MLWSNALCRGYAIIFMAINNNYALNCAVMLQSIMDNTNPKRNDDIVISTSDIAAEYKKPVKIKGRIKCFYSFD